MVEVNTLLYLDPPQPQVWPKELKPLMTPIFISTENKTSPNFPQNRAKFFILVVRPDHSFNFGRMARANFQFHPCSHAATIWTKTAAAAK